MPLFMRTSGGPLNDFRMQETLRFHSIVYHLVRAAVKDDVIPLANPVVTKTGETVSEIFVKAGQTILVSICAYNRQVV